MRIPECKIDNRFNISKFVPGIIALAFKFVCIHGVIFKEKVNRISQLDLISYTGMSILQTVKDLRDKYYRPTAPISEGAFSGAGFSTISSIRIRFGSIAFPLMMP